MLITHQGINSTSIQHDYNKSIKRVQFITREDERACAHASPHLIVQIHEVPLEVMRENVVLESAAERREEATEEQDKEKMETPS